MKNTKEIDQRLNEHAAMRVHIAQYEVDKEDAKRIISWYLISQDLEEMIACMDHAELFGKVRGASLLVIAALWEKMIITHGKIFGSSADGYSTLQAKMLDHGDLNLHQQLICIRNSYLAHRGENDFEHHKLILSVEGSAENCHIQFVVPWIKVKGQYGNPAVIRRYLKRIRKKVLLQLAYMRENYEKQIFDELGLTPNLD